MATRVLWQNAPAGTTLTDVYTAPAGNGVVVSTITVCNRNATASTFRLSIAPAAAADANSQYVYYDQVIDANETFACTFGITLAPTDVVRFKQPATGLTCQGFGVES